MTQKLKEPSMASKPTLSDWMAAHRALLAEETRLMFVAAEVASCHCDAGALREQQARLVRCREHADDLYTQVMEDLRQPGP
jgi:hypothetical protein